MTNREKLCQSTDEFLKFLFHAFPGCWGCPIKEFCTKHGEINNCSGTFKLWLESEAETKEEVTENDTKKN